MTDQPIKPDFGPNGMCQNPSGCKVSSMSWSTSHPSQIIYVPTKFSPKDFAEFAFGGFLLMAGIALIIFAASFWSSSPQDDSENQQ